MINQIKVSHLLSVSKGRLLKLFVSVRDNIPSFEESSPTKPYLVGMVMDLRELGYTSSTFLPGNPARITSFEIPLLMLPCPLELL